MAHLPAAEIQARRNAAINEILEEWQGNSEVAILCPCRIACNCMAVTEVERIILSFCLYPGELDYFYTQPFNATHGFKVRWHCDQCQEEMACGFPPLGVRLLHWSGGGRWGRVDGKGVRSAVRFCGCWGEPYLTFAITLWCWSGGSWGQQI